MKTLKILTVSFFVTCFATAQDISQADVPAIVKAAFEKEYGNASGVEWELKMENYKVEFNVKRMDSEVWYNASGIVLKKEQEITKSELPSAVLDAINLNYAGYRIDEIEKVWKDNITTYKLELEKGQVEKHINFSSEGKVIKEWLD